MDLDTYVLLKQLVRTQITQVRGNIAQAKECLRSDHPTLGKLHADLEVAMRADLQLDNLFDADKAAA